MNEKNNLNPTISRFELQCIIPRISDRVLDGLRRRCQKGDYLCVKEGYKYRRCGGGLTITCWKDWKRGTMLLKVREIQLPRLMGNISKLGLTDLSPEMLKKGEKALIDELEKLELIQLDRRCSWRMNRMVLTQDFYTEEDPNLLIKLFRYHLERRKGEILHSMQALKNSGEEGVQIGRYMLINESGRLSTIQKRMGTVPEGDMKLAQHRMRYSVLFDRSEISQLEDHYRNLYGIGQNRRLWNGFVSEYLSEMQRLIPFLMYSETALAFGHNPWADTDTVRKRMQELRESSMLILDDRMQEMVNQYLERIEQAETQDLWDELIEKDPYVKKVMDDLMRRMGLNATVIPNGILEPGGTATFSLHIYYGTNPDRESLRERNRMKEKQHSNKINLQIGVEFLCWTITLMS